MGYPEYVKRVMEAGITIYIVCCKVTPYIITSGVRTINHAQSYTFDCTDGQLVRNNVYNLEVLLVGSKVYMYFKQNIISIHSLYYISFAKILENRRSIEELSLWMQNYLC